MDIRRVRTCVAWGAALITVAGLSAGCASGSSSGPAAASGSKAPLNVAIIEGSEIPGLGNQQAGPLAAAAYINAHGGIDGHLINATYCNDGAGLYGDPNSTAACAASAVSNHSLALIGTITGFEQDVYPQIDAAGITNFPGIATSPALDNVNPMAYQVFPDSFSANAGMGMQLGQNKCAKSAIVLPQGYPQDAQYEQAFSAAVRYEGYAVGSPIELPATVTDYAPTVALAEGQGDTCLAYFITGGSLSAFLTAIRDSGKPVHVIVNETEVGPQVLKALGPLGNGVWANALLLPLELQTKQQAFLNSIIAKYQPGTPVTSFPWPQEEEMLYFSQLAAKVYADHLPMTSANIRAEIPKVALDYGITPPINFAKPGPIQGAPKVYDVSSYPEIVKNGALVSLSTTPINPEPAFEKYHLTE